MSTIWLEDVSCLNLFLNPTHPEMYDVICKTNIKKTRIYPMDALTDAILLASSSHKLPVGLHV